MSKLRIGILTVSLMLVSVAAHAVGSSGFELGTNSAKTLGKANAVVADPGDASTIAFNPAGMSELEGNHVTISTSTILFSTEYTGANGGVSEDSALNPAYVPATFVSLSTPAKPLKVGFGINAPFGLQTQHSSTGNFRYTANFNEIKTAAYTAAAASDLASWISVGGGITYMEATLKQVGKFNSNAITSTVIPGTTGLADAPFELDATGDGWGWNLGALIDVTPKDKIGIFYRSPIRVAYEGEFSANTITGLVLPSIFGGSSFNTSLTTDITFPGSLTIGWHRIIDERWSCEVDISFTGWSVFDQVDVAFGQTNAVLNGLEPVNEDFRDVISLHLAATYKINDAWEGSAGYLYYQMAGNKLNYSNAIPDGDRHGIAFGLRYSYKNLTWGASYLAEFVPDQKIDNIVGQSSNSVVDGTYSSFGQIITSDITMKF